MRITLLIHILAGGLGLVAGAVALCAAKGARLHRQSGMLFVYSMSTASASGAGIAALRSIEVSMIGGLLAVYLVITALITVRPAGSRWLALGAMLAAVGIGVTSVTLGFEALASGDSKREGIPAAVFLILGAVALLASVSDVRIVRSGGIQGTARLARHLWRMCFALSIVAASFFLGDIVGASSPEGEVAFPEPLRIPALLALPVLLVLLVMFYWLWRVRIRPPIEERLAARSHEEME